MNGKGWLKVPGIRPDGDRTLEEQMLGILPALLECAGKSVLDLGCAEGLIGAEFAKAGASRVVGIELLETHLQVARLACKDIKNISFICANLAEWIAHHEEPEQFDIVLALGIIHKLRDPAVPLEFAARSAKSLVLFRAPAHETDGRIYSKHGGTECNVPQVMKRCGFVEEKKIAGVRGEAVQYWRRKDRS